jgi:Trypsin-like peptidase domain
VSHRSFFPTLLLSLAWAAATTATAATPAAAVSDGASVGHAAVSVPERPAPVARSVALLPLPRTPDAVVGASRVEAVLALEEMRAWNRSAATPKKIGFERPLPSPISVRFEEAGRLGALRAGAGQSLRTPDGAFLWTAAVNVLEASALRLHLSSVDLPPGTRIRAFGDLNAATIEFDPAAMSVNGEIWVPRTEGATARLEVEIPSGAPVRGGFVVAGALELFTPEAAGIALPESAPGPSPDGTECMIKGECKSASDFPGIDYVRSAEAHLEFVVDGIAYICSGTLLNDKASSFTPYLLTANHCFSSSASAATLQAFFDYRYSSCSSTIQPSPSSFPNTYGSTLLAASSDGDFTFVRLSALPSGTHYLLGWSSFAVANGTSLYRISYPLGKPQYYSKTTLDTGASPCTSWPLTTHLYENLVDGATQGGSSGSAVTLANGQVVGQLHGACGTNVSDVCDAAHNYTVDGGFFYNYSAMRQWLNPQTGGCTPSDTVVCLVGGRFQVEGTYTDYSYNTGSGHAAKLTDDTGTLWFFSSSNIELLVKFVNSCTYSPTFSVYANGLTNVGVNIKVTDTKYGTVRQYSNALGHDFALIKAGDFQCP